MMEGENDGLGEGQGIFKDKEPRIKKGVSAGRIVNALMILNYFLVLLTALIVSGIFGVLNSKLHKDHHPVNSTSRACILFSDCVSHSGGNHCEFQYNDTGACEFIAAGFGIVAIVALAYIVVSVLRIIFSTDIWWSVIADLLINLASLVGVIVLGITISAGFGITCSKLKKRGDPMGCSSLGVPKQEDGYHFYGKVNAAQGAAWFCFLFLFSIVVVSLIRLCIFHRRRAKVPAMDGKEVLTAEDKPV